MCIGPSAPRAPQAAPPPPPPAAPPPIPQQVVPGQNRNRTRRQLSAQGQGANRTLLSGSLTSSGGQGATLLGG